MIRTRVFFLFYLAAIVVTLGFCYRDVWLRGSAHNHPPHWVLPHPFWMNAAEEPSPATSVFRQSASHSGHLDQPFGSHLRVSTLLPGLNVGIHGASKASPAVDDSGIYVGSDSGWFYALNLDGSLRWRFYASESTNGIHSTATLDQSTVYFGTYSGDLIAADKQTGNIRWIAKLGDAIGSSPLIFEGTLLVAVETIEEANGYLVRVRCKDGALVWRSKYFGEQSHGSPTLDQKRRLVFLGANNSHFFAFHVDGGQLAWEKTADGKIKSTMALIEDTLYFSTWGASLYAVRPENGSIVWKTPLAGRSQSSPSWVPDLDLVVLGSEPGFIYGINRHDGKERWRFPTHWLGSRFSSALVLRSIVRARRNSYGVWIGCSNTGICLLDPRDGHQILAQTLEGAVTGVPVYFGSALYLGLAEAGLIRLAEDPAPRTP